MPSADKDPELRSNSSVQLDTLGRGVFLGCGLNLGMFLLAAMAYVLLSMAGNALRLALTGSIVYFVMWLGLTQVLWLLPMHRRFRTSGKMEAAKGVLCAGAITMLISAACWRTSQ
jgi:hypothetical protein